MTEAETAAVTVKETTQTKRQSVEGIKKSLSEMSMSDEPASSTLGTDMMCRRESKRDDPASAGKVEPDPPIARAENSAGKEENASESKDGWEPEDWENLVEKEFAEWDEWTSKCKWEFAQEKEGIRLEKCYKAKDGLPAFRIKFAIRGKRGPIIEAYKYTITSGDAERNNPNCKSSQVFKLSKCGKNKIKTMHIKFPWPIWDRIIICASKPVERPGYFASYAISCEETKTMKKSFDLPPRTVAAFTRTSHEIQQVGEHDYDYTWYCQYDARGLIPSSLILYMTGILLDGACKSLRLVKKFDLTGRGLERFKARVKKHGFEAPSSDHCLYRSRSPSLGDLQSP